MMVFKNLLFFKSKKEVISECRKHEENSIETMGLFNRQRGKT